MHLKSYLFLSTSLLLIQGSAYAGHSALEHATAMANLIQYQEKHHDAIWPGFHMNKYPVIMEFIDINAPVYAFQFTPKEVEWKSTQIQNMKVHYRTDKDYDIGFYEADFLTVEDQLSLIFRVLSGFDPNRNVNSVTSYLFKDYMKNGSYFPMSSFDYAAYTYTGFNNLENVALSKLEHESINDYLKKNDIESLKNYLAVHQTRMKLLSAEDIAFEHSLELGRGIPAYVRMKTLARSDQDYIKEALDYYPRNSNSCASLSDRYYIQKCLTESHYTFIDLAAGYALDKMAKPDWKNKAETQGKSFTTILNQHFSMDQNEVEQRIQHTKNLYGYESKLSALQNTMKDYLKNMQAQLSSYQQLPGFEVSIETTGCSILEGALFDKAYTVNSKSKFYTNYKAFNLCDGKKYRMSLNYDYIPYRFAREEHNPDHSITEFNTVKLSNDTLLVVNDRQETVGSFIQAGKKEKFNRLLIENSQFMVRIVGLEGTLDGSGNALKMTLAKTDAGKKNHF